MVEAKTRVVEFQDVKPEDFVRFLEYAYCHDYTIPSYMEDKETSPPALEHPASPEFEGVPPAPAPAPAPAPPPPIADEPAPEIVEGVSVFVEERWDIPRKKKKGKPSLRSGFDKLSYLSTGDPKAGMLQSFEPQYNSSSRQNFIPVFLAHARLYTFANMHLVQPLKSLTLHKLHKTLRGFQLYDRRVGDVLELARYAYDHGPDRTSQGGIDDLRNLVVQYIACELDTIGKHRDFRYLMEEGGEFVGDFWGIVQMNLVSRLTGVVI
ncbi:unnamed protein product [Periconia digitata]|uniref:BTB domain-containing protein n=1 Tax=Periconia digitata TaxID=1303443 RepID=A0A9W4XJ46_9PLEO|nr:unnamed protein product [Periconia digitata]